MKDNSATADQIITVPRRRAFEGRWGEGVRAIGFKQWMLLIPPVIFIVVFLLYPLGDLFLMSIEEQGHFTLQYYIRFFSEATYFKVLGLTLKTGGIVTMVCLLLGYPVAYTMTFCSKTTRTIIMMGILIPFWTSLLVRTYAWMVLLQTQGVINQVLLKIGLISHPLALIYNTTGVIIGMTHVLLPYMILSLYSVMQGIDVNLISAARSLGASKSKAFLRVFLPLSARGIASGSILVFVMGIGYFITPSLLGGQNSSMISQLIQVQVNDLLNWGFASAIAFTLLAVTLLLMMMSKRLMRVEN